MIQIITNNVKKYSNFSKQKFLISGIDEFQSLDNYDVTVVDISDKDLWYNKGDSCNNINQYMDFRSIQSAILKSKKSSNVVILPQNIEFNYSYHYVGNIKRYTEMKKIKDMRKNFIEILSSNLINMNLIGINFGKSYTKVRNTTIVADFCFSNVDEKNIILKALNGSDIVAIKNDQTIITSLMISTEEEMSNLLTTLFPSCFEDSNEAPDWIKEVDFYTDKQCNEKITDINKKIDDLEKEKKEWENKIFENSKNKSILYESGDKLAKQVNGILSQIFEYDMSEFEDTYEEDGIVKLNDVTFIIETKGLNHEITGHNVSDACNHLIMYEDKLEEKGIEEDAKCLFIVAYERNKNINERVEIKNRIEKIAKANNTLIIDTRSFLKIYEDYLNGKITKKDIEELFTKNIGVLHYKSK